MSIANTLKMSLQHEQQLIASRHRQNSLLYQQHQQSQILYMSSNEQIFFAAQAQSEYQMQMEIRRLEMANRK